MKNRLLFLISIYTLGNISYSQDRDLKFQEKSVSELITTYYTVEDSLLRRGLASEIVGYGYIESDTSKILTGYFLLANSSTSSSKERIADSLIKYGTFNPNKNYPGVGYLTKGDSFFEQNKFQLALDAYLKAYSYSKSFQNPSLSHVVAYNIGILKIRAGDYLEAKKILLEYFNSSETQGANGQYIQGSYALADVYNRLKKTDSSRYYQKKGIDRAKSINDKEMITYLELAEAQSDYNDGQYEQTISKSNLVLEYFKDKGDNVLLAEIYNLQGRSLWNLERKDKAIGYFKKVDTLFNLEKDLYPSEREAYTLLIEYYNNDDQIRKKLYYINQLLKLDSIIYSNSNYLNNTIYTTYTTNELLAEKNEIVNKLKEQNRYKKGIIGGLLVLIGGFGSWIYLLIKKSKKNKKTFEQLVQNNDLIEISSNNKNDINLKTETNISEDIITDLLSKLELFEAEKGFLNSNITLQKLAKQMKSNAKYLSSVINEEKKTSFSNYLNKLRIDYAVDRLKNDRKFRKYTIKAIALESGFNNSESFSRVFKSQTKLRPSYFVKKLIEENL